MKRLGALAAQLKTKDELYDALVRLAPDSLGLKEKEKVAAVEKPGKAAKGPSRPSAKPPAKAPVRPSSPPTSKAQARAARAPKEPPQSPPRPVKVTRAPLKPPDAPAITAPQRMPKKPKLEERTVVRDFFVEPGTRPLPAAFGDDRVLLFPREPTGVYVSWDLSPETFGRGRMQLVVRAHDGKVVWAQQLDSAQGSASLVGDFGGASLRAVIRLGDEPISASPAVTLPGSQGELATRWRVRIDPDEPLPQEPERLAAPEGPSESFGLEGAAPSRLGAGRKAGQGAGAGGGRAPSRLG